MTNNFLINNFKHLTTSPENVEQLKKLVLQMAVQGKLTAKWREDVKTQGLASPDDPNYNAHALLKKIKTEKEQHIKEGKIKRQKPLPPITDEEKPFDLPDSWKWERLGNLFTVKSGKRIHAADYCKDGIPFLRSGEIGTLGRGEEISNPLFISEKKYNEIKKKFGVPKKGDILIACIGGSIGNTWIVDERKFYYKDGNLVLIESLDSLNTNFLHFYLKSHLFWSNTILNATDSSYNALTIIKLNNAVFPVPSLAEQQAIVNQVDKLFTQIDQLHALAQKRLNYREKSAKALFSKINHTENDTELQETWQTLTTHFHPLTQSKESVKQLRQSILQMAVQGKLTAKWREENPDVEPARELLKKINAEKEQLIKEGKIKRQKTLPQISDEEILFEFPERWEVLRLGDLIRISSGDGLTANQMDKSGIIPVYGGNGINGYHSDFNIKDRHIIIGRVGANCGAVHMTKEKAWVTDNAFITFHSNLIYQDWLYHILIGLNLRNYARESAQPVISGQRVYPITLGLPPFAEQKAIVSKVNQLMSWCDELEKKIEKRDAYQEKMMQAVVKQAFKTEKETVETE